MCTMCKIQSQTKKKYYKDRDRTKVPPTHIKINLCSLKGYQNEL